MAANDDAVRQAVALLDRCEAVAGLAPLRALWEDRARYYERLGAAAQAQAARGRTLLAAKAMSQQAYAALVAEGAHG